MQVSVVGCCLLAGVMGAQQSREAATPCTVAANRLLASVLGATGSTRFRGTTSAGRITGTLSRLKCSGEDLRIRNVNDPTHPGIALSDLRTLEVARWRPAGWKGALAGAIVGSALAAAFPPGENRNHGVFLWGLTAAFAGLGFPITEWRPVTLSPAPASTRESPATTHR